MMKMNFCIDRDVIYYKHTQYNWNRTDFNENNDIIVKRNKGNKKERGFTLMELMIVIAIIGILAAVAIPNFLAYREKAYKASIEKDMNNAINYTELSKIISSEAQEKCEKIYGCKCPVNSPDCDLYTVTKVPSKYGSGYNYYANCLGDCLKIVMEIGPGHSFFLKESVTLMTKNKTTIEGKNGNNGAFFAGFYLGRDITYCSNGESHLGQDLDLCQE